MDEAETVRAREVERLPSDIKNVIFSWSLQDIFNKNLYKHKVENIPQTFDSINVYFRSFIFPLLEETRADLCSSMEVISGAPFSEIKFITQKKDQLYEITVSPWKNKYISGSSEIYTPSSGDIIILADRKAETVDDFCRYGCRYVLASVTKVKNMDVDFEENHSENDEDEDEQVLTIHPSFDLDADNDMEIYRYITFLMNITTNYRIWKALGLGRGLTQDLDMIKKVLSKDSLSAGGTCDQCHEHEVESLGSSSSELNDSQREAIIDSFVTSQCKHRRSVKLIWGPPGTGKTKTLSKLLHLLSENNLRILTCAPTNVAISEVISRVMKLYQNDSITKRISGFSCYRLGDIVLFGNKDRLKIDDNLRDVYLDYRVDRILQCLSSKCGWTYQIKSMINFLEHSVSKYNPHPDMDSPTFLEFMVEKFQALAFPLTTCLVSMCTHLPTSTVSKNNFEDIVTLVNLLDSFGNLLSHFEKSNKELEEIFIQLMEATDKNSSDLMLSSNRSTLYDTGKQLLCIMRSLLKNLSIPKFEFGESRRARYFCLNGASLVFCTVATSFLLHGGKFPFKLTPFNLLIIDEASQLKESESTIPLQLCGIKHAFLIGDECQLSATVKSEVSESVGFGRSLFERLSILGHPKHLLEVQYRMHPSISLFPNSEFYCGRILDADNVKSKSYEKSYIPGVMYGPFSFISVDGKEEHDAVGQSRKNMVEVGVILRIIRNLYQAWCITHQKLSIGIISPYAAQISTIREKLKNFQLHNDFVVNVKTVDGFQGGEEDVIIISTVRSNSSGKIGFLSNRQRTNVALTRARHCLWIVGSGATLAKSGSVWDSLVRDAMQRECFFDAHKEKDLAKIILQVKKDLDQMDDLLNKDSVLFRSSLWKVLFSNDFLISFRSIRSTQLKMGTLNLLLKLAGGWRPKNCNTSSTSENCSQLIKQFKIEGLYIICSIDIMKYTIYTQVLKVWDILPLSDIPKLIKRLDSVFRTYSDDFFNRCKTELFDSSKNLVIPATWDNNKSFIKYKTLLTETPTVESDAETSDSRNYVENSKVSESLLLMKFYSLTSGAVNHLLSNSDGKEIDVPFEVNDQEREIILFSQTSFIIGRSGTGKTTVLTMKLIQKEQLRYLSEEGYNDSVIGYSGTVCKANENEDEDFLRQLFVTVSPKLCSAVRDHIHRLKSFVCGGEYSATTSGMHDIGDSLSAFSDIPDSFSNIPIKNYPLVITFQKFLIMLDGSLDNSFFERFQDGSELSLKATGISKSVVLQTLIRQKEVTYNRFTFLYWPHLNARLTKNLDSSIVFTEIISHIKGGLKTNETLDGRLSREDYIKLSENRSSSLNHNTREVIYDIFLEYEKRKSMNGEFDLSDLVNDLHCRVKTCGRIVGDQLDFVYVDEVQDLTMRQISLFRYVCKNFDEGYVFAGDTAQTIARGIDFRFQDIRSLFYSVFLSDQNSKGGASKSISDMFQLNQNFRTHAGVLKLAQSVVDILYFFFPSSIDHLKPETSLIFGEPPILLECGNDENAIITLFGNHVDHSCKSRSIGFGADQVVLVRDEFCKQKISADIGKQALVLTILECKGLEFQDVLLYNFFGDSPMKNNWRVVYDFMNMNNLLDTNTSSVRSFEMTRHNVLCSELKQLYVAITRTRQRLWICENVEDYSKPMFDYWKKLCLVQVRQLDVSITQAMFVTSSSEEWRDRGIKLFNDGNYEMATMCFENAGDAFREKWSRACGLRASAERVIHSNFKEGRNLLTEAAEIYENIGKFELAASCYIELRNFERAGIIYMEKCGDARLQEAGNCFSQAKLWSCAAKAYAKGNCYLKCLSVCSTGNLFEVGLDHIENWRAHQTYEPSEEWENIEIPFLEKCALHYHKIKDKKQMMKFVSAFNSITNARNFLMPRGYIDELLLMEEDLENFEEAANLAKIKGDLILQANMLEKAGKFEASSKVYLFNVLVNSLWTMNGNGWPLKPFKQKLDLLKRARLSAEKCSESFCEAVNLDICILEDTKRNFADLTEILTSATRLKIVRAQVFAARKILDFHIKLDSLKFQWENKIDDNPEKQLSKLQHNLFSSETLFYIWNFWKEKICSIVDFLEKTDFSIYGNGGLKEFCMDYFGVQGFNDKSYIVYNPDALGGKISLKKDGKCSLIDIGQFVSVAKRYWVSELILVGIEVLGCLERLRISISSSNQGVTLLHIFKLSKFLIDYQQIHVKSNLNLKNLKDNLALSKSIFFDLVFPLDWRLVQNEIIVALRETDVSEELLKDVLVENVNGEFTYGKAGRTSMIAMVIRNPEKELFENILTSLDDNSLWKIFIENLWNKKPGFGQILVASSLQDALYSTFQFDWQNEVDYISPPFFLYLLDRLLYMVSSQNSYFYTTKCSFVEALCCSESCCCLEVDDSYDHKFYLETFNCLACIIQQIIFDYHGTTQWILKSKLTVQYHPFMLLKLTIMIGIIYLNSKLCLDILVDVLWMRNISSLLPKPFYDYLSNADGSSFHDLFCSALESVGDPLLIVKLTGDSPNSMCMNSLFVDISVMESREDVMNVLFPKRLSVRQNIESTSSEDIKISNVANDHRHHKELDPDLTISEKNIGIKECAHLCATFHDYLWEVKNGNSYAHALQLKMEVEKFLPLILDRTSILNQSVLPDDGKAILTEINQLIDDLLQLSNALNASEEILGTASPVLEHTLEMLLKKSSCIQACFDLVLKKKDDNAEENLVSNTFSGQHDNQAIENNNDDSVIKNDTNHVTENDSVPVTKATSKHQQKKQKKSNRKTNRKRK